jgi:predicted DsbA family dithiol-disulfide isomerase
VLNRVITVLLVCACAGFAAVRVHQEFGGRVTEPMVPEPEYISDWDEVLGSAVAGGAPNPAIRIVEFLDLECPACRSYDPILQRAIRGLHGHASVEWVHLPLPIHRNALQAARAAECAAKQGRLEPFVRAVFARQKYLGRMPYEAYAASAQVPDMKRFSECVADSAPVAAVEAGREIAKRLEIHATPAIVVNGWRYSALPGPRTLNQFLRKLQQGKVAAPGTSGVQAMPVMPSRRMEAGVAVLAHRVRAFQAAPQLEVLDRAISRFGGPDADPATDLTDAREYQLLSEGRVAALDPRTPRILMLGPPNGVITPIGRRGAGPGELRGVGSIARIGPDTVLVPDFWNMRMQWVVPSGSFVRTANLQDRLPATTTAVVGGLPGGFAVWTTAWRLDPMPSAPGVVYRSSASVGVLPPSGAGTVIARIPDVEIVNLETRYEGTRGTEARPLHLSRRAHISVWDTTIVTGTGDGYRLDLRDRTGRIYASIVVDVPRRAVTQPIRQAVIRAELQRLASYRERPRDPGESERLIREAPFADSLPPYELLSVSPGGRLWVLDAIAPNDTLWMATAFRTDGAILGRLYGRPKTGTPVAFGDTTVVLKATDSDGVVAIGLHRIVPRR